MLQRRPPKHGSRETPAAPPSRPRPHFRRGKARLPDQRGAGPEPPPAGQIRPQDESTAFGNASAAGRVGRGYSLDPCFGECRSATADLGARMPRITDCQHRGPGSTPAPPARPSPVTRTNAQVYRSRRDESRAAARGACPSISRSAPAEPAATNVGDMGTMSGPHVEVHQGVTPVFLPRARRGRT